MLEVLKGSPLVAFAAALFVALVATPVVRVLAWRANALAQPDTRRLHGQPIAQWGGLAIFVGVAIAAILWRQPTANDFRQLAASGTPAAVQAVKQSVHLSAAFFGHEPAGESQHTAAVAWPLAPAPQIPS
jgi:UDP-N-acetylmuramyl pentapeptide phosphotransferase/UDP-N-acetylglucosamine-1-phosphate transferase